MSRQDNGMLDDDHNDDDLPQQHPRQLHRDKFALANKAMAGHTGNNHSIEWKTT